MGQAISTRRPTPQQRETAQRAAHDVALVRAYPPRSCPAPDPNYEASLQAWYDAHPPGPPQQRETAQRAAHDVALVRAYSPRSCPAPDPNYEASLQAWYDAHPPGPQPLVQLRALDLRTDVDIFVINNAAATAEYAMRRVHVTGLLGRMGVAAANVRFVRDEGTDYPACLSRAKAEALVGFTASSKPRLVLEDDVAWDGRAVVDVPLDAQIVFLGVMAAGAAEDGSFSSCAVRATAVHPAQSHVLRVHNMLGGHAVLYLDATATALAMNLYTLAAQTQTRPGGSSPLHSDVALARVLPCLTAYACNPPAFWQSADAASGDAERQAATAHASRQQLGADGRWSTYDARAK